VKSGFTRPGFGGLATRDVEPATSSSTDLEAVEVSRLGGVACGLYQFDPHDGDELG
jgi:hypothetical protein